MAPLGLGGGDNPLPSPWNSRASPSTWVSKYKPLSNKGLG
jgi:hypothetical protein